MSGTSRRKGGKQGRGEGGKQVTRSRREARRQAVGREVWREARRTLGESGGGKQVTRSRKRGKEARKQGGRKRSREAGREARR